MSVEIHCPHCDANEHVHSRFRGRRVHCPRCDSWVDVPEEAPESEFSAAAEAPVAESTEATDVWASLGAGAVESGVPTPTAVIASSLHPSVDVDQGHGLGLNFDDDEDPPKRKKREEGELDMTPMVDVTFLLLIFFMVTASFSLQKSIQMPRQQSDAPSASVVEEETEELDMVEVQVDEFGAFLVLAPDWERETPGKQNLISALKEAMGGGADGMRLVIKVHEAAKLQSLVDCMDAGTIAGFTELQVTQVEQFE